MASLKDLGRDIGKNKLLRYTLIFTGAIILFVLYERNKNASSTLTGSDAVASLQASTPTIDSGTYVQDSYSYYAPTTVNNPVIAATQSSTTPTPTSSTSTTPYFSAPIQVIQNSFKSGKPAYWNAYNPTTKQSTNIASLFPSGTKFSANSSGQAFYTLPGTNTLLPLSAVGLYGHQHK